MTSILNFLKTTAIGGLLVIIPISVLLFLFAQLLIGVYSVGLEISAALPAAIPDNPTFILLLAFAAIVGVCFFTGLVVRTRIGKALKDRFERRVGKWIPMYKPIRSLTRRFAGIEEDQFAPVEVDLHGSAARAIGFLVETFPDGRHAVFVPGSPVATVGHVYLLPAECVTQLPATTASAITALTQWGIEASALYRPSPADE